MGRYFGTDGFRGEANKDLTAAQAFQVGRYFGWYCTQTHAGDGAPCIVIGKDTRRSSYMFEYALAAGITASGCDAYLLHVTTTPSVAYVARTGDFDMGIMISASHNPFYDNGIKVMSGSGEKLSDEALEGVEKFLAGELTDQDVPYARREAIGRTVDYEAGRNRYMGYLISIATRSFKGKKVALDTANGSSYTIAKNVFDALGAHTYMLGNEPNGTNINMDCGSTHPEALCAFVKENGCDLGFAFDGDADRCIAVDENGQIVDGDKILYICGKFMKEQGTLFNKTVVTTVMSNIGLYKAFDREGISYEKTKVGDKYVYENMLANGNCLGGEQSGHIIFSKHATTGDGILTALKIMEVVLETRRTLGDLASEVKIYPQVLKNVRVADKNAAQENAAVQAAVGRVSMRLAEEGRILLRASGTEPVIRVMVEASTHEQCEACVDEVIHVMEEEGLTI